MNRDEERLRKRRSRLAAMGDLHRDVCRNRARIRASGRRPEVVLVRSDFIAVPEERRPLHTRRPPVAGLLTPHGIGLQTYLVALFEAQAGRTSGARPINNRPLVATERGELGWLNLIASPAAANPTATKERATVTDNRLRQLKAALTTLEQAGLVGLKGDRAHNGRFEGFELRHESGSPMSSDPIPYTVPPSGGSGTVRLPVDFFLRGWVHVLQPSEIATYLMFRLLSQLYPREHSSAGVYIPGADREDRFGLSRDVYESHRTLSSLGLIRLMPDPARRPDGRVRNYHERVRRGEPVLSHRFKVLDDDSLDRNALIVLQKHLKRRLGPAPVD